MDHIQLLPGTRGPEATRPSTSFRPHAVIRSARRQAAIKNLFDALTLLLIDGLVFYWPDARLPFTMRETTVALVAMLNAAFLATWLIRRKLPEWKARRIAATWEPEERQRALCVQRARRAR